MNWELGGGGGGRLCKGEVGICPFFFPCQGMTYSWVSGKKFQTYTVYLYAIFSCYSQLSPSLPQQLFFTL